MNDDRLPLIIFIAGVLCMVAFGMGVDTGKGINKRHYEREAVKVGVAQWVTTTNENGEASTEFKWIVPTEKKEK